VFILSYGLLNDSPRKKNKNDVFEGQTRNFHKCPQMSLKWEGISRIFHFNALSFCVAHDKSFPSFRFSFLFPPHTRTLSSFFLSFFLFLLLSSPSPPAQQLTSSLSLPFLLPLVSLAPTHTQPVARESFCREDVARKRSRRRRRRRNGFQPCTSREVKILSFSLHFHFTHRFYITKIRFIWVGNYGLSLGLIFVEIFGGNTKWVFQIVLISLGCFMFLDGSEFRVLLG
jgi:hypothetical protein